MFLYIWQFLWSVSCDSFNKAIGFLFNRNPNILSDSYLTCFDRGCVFITYEVFALKQAVTIDTSAILQEKHKSYIYLTHATNREQESLASGTSCSLFYCIVIYMHFDRCSKWIDISLALRNDLSVEQQEHYCSCKTLTHNCIYST